jgi:hypothetical protein
MKIWTLMMFVSTYSGVTYGQSTKQAHEILIERRQVRQDNLADLGNIWYDEFEKVKGTYYFENGKYMHLSMWGNRMYAEIEGNNRFALVSASPYVFLGRNQKVKITVEDPDVSSGAIHATVVLASSLLSNLAPKDELITLVAHR